MELNDAETGPRMKFYAETKLGAKQSLTPEGFLLCEDVPISRIGELVYVDGEIPLDPGPDGVIRVERNPEDVFNPESMASFAGKPVTNDHPDEEVTPSNWKQYAVGTVQNPRIGVGPLSGCVVADLLITDEDAIEEVRSGKREVSCGYDAEYQQVSPGRGVQRQIVGNHVALVERGRCGPRCSISDKRGEVVMAKTLKERVLAAIRGDGTTTDEEGGLHVHVGNDEGGEKEKVMDEFMKSCDKRFGDLETSIKGMADAFAEMTKKAGEEADDEAGDPDTSDEEGTEEEKSASAKDSMKDVLARAEIIAPGLTLSMPTYDGKKKKPLKAFNDSLCSCKKQALSTLAKTDDGKKVIERFLGKLTVDTAPRSLIDVAFAGASELLRDKNNSSASRSSISIRDFGKAPISAAEINERNKKFHAARGVGV